MEKQTYRNTQENTEKEKLWMGFTPIKYQNIIQSVYNYNSLVLAYEDK